MDKPAIQRSDLSGIRQEIDSIDEQIVELLCARFAASEKVRLAKTSSLLAGGMPYRPGREAVILRRLVEIADGRVPVGVIERVWRTVISASILAQADVRIVTVSEVMTDARYRQAIDLFSSLVPIEKAGSLKAALGALADHEQVLVVVPMKLDWRGILDQTGDGPRAARGGGSGCRFGQAGKVTCGAWSCAERADGRGRNAAGDDWQTAARLCPQADMASETG